MRISATSYNVGVDVDEMVRHLRLTADTKEEAIMLAFLLRVIKKKGHYALYVRDSIGDKEFEACIDELVHYKYPSGGK